MPLLPWRLSRKLPLKAKRPVILRLEYLEERCTPSVTVTRTSDNATFTTIQAAINDAATVTGTILQVNAGTDAEAVTINKSITLKGAQHGVDAQNGRPGAMETVMDGTTIGGATPFNITANNVTIDGFTVQGATVGASGFGIVLGVGTSGSQILNNIIQNNVSGLSLANNSTASQTVVQNNLFQTNNQPGASSGDAIYTNQVLAGGTLSDVLIDNNTFKNNSDAGLNFESTDPTKPSTGVTISNNVFDANERGLLAFNLTSSSISSNTFSNSTLASSADIRLFEGVNGLTITNNLMENGAGSALRISNEGSFPALNNATNVSFNQNSLSGYGGTAGVFQIDSGGYTGTLDATLNYWGSSTGPTSPHNPGGTGESISDPNSQVTFSPFLVSGVNARPNAPGFQPGADVAVAETGPTTVNAGDTVTYHITTTNAGPLDAQNVLTSDTLPAHTSLTSFTQDTGPANGGTLPAGQTQTFTLVVTADANTPDDTVITNTAHVTSGSPIDPNSANNTATADTTVKNSADMAVTNTDNQTTAHPGIPVTYTVVVSNSGPKDATNATVTDVLPSDLNNVTFTATGSGGANGFTPGGSGNIHDTVNVPVGATITYTVTGIVSSSATGTLSNTAAVTLPGPMSDPHASNNSATDNDAITPLNGGFVIDGTAGGVTVVVTAAGPDSGSYTVNGGPPVPFTNATSFTFDGGQAILSSSTIRPAVCSRLPAASSITAAPAPTVCKFSMVLALTRTSPSAPTAPAAGTTGALP